MTALACLDAGLEREGTRARGHEGTSGLRLAPFRLALRRVCAWTGADPGSPAPRESRARRWPRFLLASALLALMGCGGESDPLPPVEIVTPQPVDLTIPAQGVASAARSTPLPVPGQNFARRQLVWVAPEGSLVRSGEVLARFASPRGEVDLSEARTALLRNALARAGKQADLGLGVSRIDADLAGVDTDVLIAERYADESLEYLARVEILDALQDRLFLGEKKDYLGWKRERADRTGAAELAVLDSQRQSQTQRVADREADQTALELLAPHDGVFMLESDWSGEKPRLGAMLWAGNEFASLPDPAALEFEFSLPQLDAAGIEVGTPVSLHPAGRPQELIASSISWVATSAQPASRQNPVKRVKMKAKLPDAEVRRLGLVPGQSLVARVHALRAEQAITVANIALIDDGNGSAVEVLTGSRRERRPVTLGARGTMRSVVSAGLETGDVVVLAPTRGEAE